MKKLLQKLQFLFLSKTKLVARFSHSGKRFKMLRFLKIACAASIINGLLGFHFIDIKSLKATELTFFCGSERYRGEVVPTTYVNHETGGNATALVYWVSDYFSNSGETPEQRCGMASERLQAYHDNGLLGYIDTNVVNNLPVICIARIAGDECTESDIIITLPPDVNRFEALRVMTNLARLINGEPINLNDDLVIYRNGEAYVNFEIFIEISKGDK